jgi:hypothetical protein
MDQFRNQFNGVGTSMVHIENKSNFVANITSSSSSEILEWKS